MNKYHNIVEFNKIIELLQEEVFLDYNKRKLNEYVLSNDLEEIEKSLVEVEEATILIQRMQRFPLFFSSDVEYLLKKVSKSGVLVESELLEIGRFLDTIKSNQMFYDSLVDSKINAENFGKYIDKLIYPKELNIRIKEIITPYGEIKDDASSELAQIRKKIKDHEKNIQLKLQEIVSKNSSKLTQSIISIRNDRYVIPVKNDFKNTVKGIIHDQSASGETVFIEPTIIFNLNNALNQFKEAEKKEIYHILRNISNEIDSFNEVLTQDYFIVCQLDLIFAKANFAIKINGKKPKINKQGIVDLLNCYHPLLKVDKVVSNNIMLGKDYQGIIITGPNTGGKTVLLKTIGLLSLMVKFGLLIPCDDNSNIMIFDNVFADIGDEQSIDQNLSTFSSHLKNVIEIMNNVTNNSLVLLDELGSGTDPAEGASLAIAIFDTLIEKKCLVIATSHYSELKIHAFNSNNIINASVEFDIETLKPTYKLLMGIPGQSNALKISKILGLPENIIKKAENYVYEKSDNLSKVLDKLTIQTKELDNKLLSLEEKNKQLNQKLKTADEELEKVYNEKNQILKSAEKEAQIIINNSSNKINQILEELNLMKLREVKLHEIADVKHSIKELKEEVHVEEEFVKKEYEFEINSNVFVENYGAHGKIIKTNKNNKYDVQIGIATVTVDKKYLKPSNSNTIVKKVTTITPRLKKNVSMSLDLRGERFKDAQIKLEKYIDDAIYAGLLQVSIIHGFGTGVIREMVQKFLKKSKYVEAFRYGGANEGGQGATIVTLKN